MILQGITAFPSDGFTSLPPPQAGELPVAFWLLVILLVAVPVVLAILRLVLHRVSRERIGLKLAVLLVTVAKEAEKAEEKDRKAPSVEEIREDIGVAETLMGVIGSLHPKAGFTSWLMGRQDTFAFEMVAHQGVISFYLAVPQRFKEFMEQQIHAHYHGAHVEEVEDYNIFSPRGAANAAYLTFKKPNMFPLKTYRKLEADPLNGLTNALGKIKQNEGAVIQYVVASAHKRWREYGVRVARLMQQGRRTDTAMRGATWYGEVLGWGKMHSQKKTKEGVAPHEPYRLSPLEEEMVKGLEEKASKAGLECNVRIVTSAATRERARQILDNITNAFGQFAIFQYGNGFVRATPHNQARVIHESIYRAFNPRRKIVVNAEEMASLYHFPLPTTETPNIRWLMARTAPAPVNVPTEGLLLGVNRYRGVETKIFIKPADRRRHLYIIGRSGGGKSEFIKSMAIQDIVNGEGVCVVDPHGDLIEGILEHIPPHRVDDVIVFDPSDTERPVGLNMLEVKHDSQKDMAVQEMIAIFYKLFPPEMIGPMFEHNMRNVMLTLMADPEDSGTLAEIPRMFTDPDFQKSWVAKLRDPMVLAFWEKEMAKTSDFHKSEMLGYLISKVGRFVENEMMRNIIGQMRSGFDVREVMDKRKILLVNLAKGRTGEVNSSLLGLIIVSKLQMAALSRADIPESERHDFYLYIDEFQNFITDSISTILSEARKYRLSLIIAHQYMGQLADKEKGDTKIRDAVLGNAGTIATFRIGIEDAEVLVKEFQPTFNEFDLINVDKFTVNIKLLVDNTATKPFTMGTLMPPPGDRKLAEAIKQLSRLKYGRDKAIVESEILERAALGMNLSSSQPSPTAERGL